MEKADVERVTIAAEENAVPEKQLSHAYDGDHVTHQGVRSATERSLFWKSAIIITSLASLVYFVAYLDRNSIGNARVAGMQADLEMTDRQYTTAVSMFFVGYILFMLPGNLLLRYIPPNFQLGGSVIIFGAFVTGLGGAQNYETVLAIRILIGFAQAFIQGLSVYTSLWFKRNEVASIGATFYSAATISGAFSGLIAYGAVKNLSEESTGLAPWRWVYIIDGVVGMFVGLMTLLLLPRFPDKIKNGKHWLFTRAEIDLACERASSFNTLGAKFDARQLWPAVKDPKSWAFMAMQTGVATGVGTVSAFIPSFIKEFGYTRHHFNKIGVFLMGTITTAIIGYIILISNNASAAVNVFATCLITSGLYPSVVLLVSWLSINTGGFTKRGTTWAMAEVAGQAFSIGGSHIYENVTHGHAWNLAFLSLALFSTVAITWWMRRENLRKDQIDADYLARGEIHPHATR